MSLVRSAVNFKPLLWLILATPAFIYIARFASADVLPMDLVPPPGEMSARLIIIALMVTPLSLLFRGRKWISWLMQRRRAFGVAAFLYALLHLFFYILDMETAANVLAEVAIPSILAGWVALLLFLPLAVTSNDYSMRALRTGWKRLQRLAYPAALLTLVHWILIHDRATEAILHAAPLIALEMYRLAHILRRRASNQPKFVQNN